MSHGPGVTMRGVVERLAELDAGSARPRWHALGEVAGEGASAGRVASVRRAVGSLRRDGVVVTSYRLGAMTSRGRPGKLHVRLARRPVADGARVPSGGVDAGAVV
jgi:hypothetical protein